VTFDYERWCHIRSASVSNQPEWRVVGEATDGLEADHMAQLAACKRLISATFVGHLLISRLSTTETTNLSLVLMLVAAIH